MAVSTNAVKADPFVNVAAQAGLKTANVIRQAGMNQLNAVAQSGWNTANLVTRGKRNLVAHRWRKPQSVSSDLQVNKL